MAAAKSSRTIDWTGAQSEADTVRAIAAVLVDLPTIDVAGTLFRAVYLKYLLPIDGSKPEPLYFLGSLAGGRYTPRHGPAGLYLGFDPSTLPAELRTVLFDHGRPTKTKEHDPVLTVSVRARVSRVLDLTKPSVQRALGLTKAMLLSDWETEMKAYLAGHGPMPPTQLLALAAHLTGLFAGIKYPSARTSFGKNLVVFPDRLDAALGDELSVIDSKKRFRQRLP